jgi:hypothetical protein
MKRIEIAPDAALSSDKYSSGLSGLDAAVGG